jgi:hypothetical protein
MEEKENSTFLPANHYQNWKLKDLKYQRPLAAHVHPSAGKLPLTMSESTKILKN